MKMKGCPACNSDGQGISDPFCYICEGEGFIPDEPVSHCQACGLPVELGLELPASPTSRRPVAGVEPGTDMMHWLITIGIGAIALLIGYLVGFDLGENYAIKRTHLIMRKYLLRAELEAAEIEALNLKAQVQEWTEND